MMHHGSTSETINGEFAMFLAEMSLEEQGHAVEVMKFLGSFLNRNDECKYLKKPLMSRNYLFRAMIPGVALLLLLNLFTQTPNKKLRPFWHPLSVRAIITWTFKHIVQHIQKRLGHKPPEAYAPSTAL